MSFKLLMTGGGGFVGFNIWPLVSRQFNTVTLGISGTEDYILNLSSDIPSFKETFDIILHAAGKAHSSLNTETEKSEFFKVNLQGTINLCKGLENSGIPKSFIFISTVAVYGLDYGTDINESHPLNGNTPYALSKIQAEQFLNNWCNQHNVTLTIIRPSLIAGPNPPGNLGAMIKGIKSNKYFRIGEGQARKSILMVNDIANVIPLLIDKGGIYNLCDSHHPSFKELEDLISKQLNKPSPKSIPYSIAKSFALIGDLVGNKAPINSYKLDKITKSLTFSNAKARRELGWEPMGVLENFRI